MPATFTFTGFTVTMELVIFPSTLSYQIYPPKFGKLYFLLTYLTDNKNNYNKFEVERDQYNLVLSDIYPKVIFDSFK